MSSPKRHVFIAILFLLKCFSKLFIIRSYTKRKWGDRQGGSRSSPWDMSCGSLCSSGSLSFETSAWPTSVWCLKEKQRFHVMADEVSLRTWERGKTACGHLGKQASTRKRDFRSSKNNFRGHDISRPTPWASLSVSSFSLGYTYFIGSL